MYINFLDKFSIKIELNNSYINYFKQKYINYFSKKPNTNLIASIKHGKNQFVYKSEIIRPPIGNSKNGIFIFDNNDNTLITNFENLGTKYCNVFISNKFNKDFLANFIEFVIYLIIKKKNSTIIHASAFYIKNKTILCPAWRNVGKTDILLEALNYGAKYIGDDWIICDSNGFISEFPKNINLFPYNLSNVASLKDSNEFLSTYINLKKIIDKTKYFNKKIKKEIIDKSPNIHFSQRTLKNSLQPLKKLKVDRIFWLNNYHPSKKNLKIFKCSKKNLINHIQATQNLELYPFYQAIKIHSGLYGSFNKLSNFSNKKIINRMVDRCSHKYIINVNTKDTSSNIFKIIDQHI